VGYPDIQIQIRKYNTLLEFTLKSETHTYPLDIIEFK